MVGCERLAVLLAADQIPGSAFPREHRGENSGQRSASLAEQGDKTMHSGNNKRIPNETLADERLRSVTTTSVAAAPA